MRSEKSLPSTRRWRRAVNNPDSYFCACTGSKSFPTATKGMFPSVQAQRAQTQGKQQGNFSPNWELHQILGYAKTQRNKAVKNSLISLMWQEPKRRDLYLTHLYWMWQDREKLFHPFKSNLLLNAYKKVCSTSIFTIILNWIYGLFFNFF